MVSDELSPDRELLDQRCNIENYTHVSEEQIRRVDIEWRGTEVKAFERLRARAEREDVTVAALIKRLLKRLN